MGPRTHRLVFGQECAAPDPPDLHESNHRLGANVVALQMKPKPVFLAFTILATFIGCSPEKDTTVPADLIGVWRTGAPQYADTFLQFTTNGVTLRKDEYTYDSYAIVNIENVSEDSRTLYTISYEDLDGGEYKLSFYYDPANGGLIRFKNQEHLIWAREEAN
ncbi:MAG: hypothetical protein V3U86_11155 [Acidobacteriota bacterium]